MRVYRIKSINGFTLELRNKEEKLTRFIPEAMANRMFTETLYPESPCPPRDLAKEIESDLLNQVEGEKKMARRNTEVEDKDTKKKVVDIGSKKASAKEKSERTPRETKYEYPDGMTDAKEKQRYRAQQRAIAKKEEKEAEEAAAAKAARKAAKAAK
jgi:hypothetical protein